MKDKKVVKNTKKVVSKGESAYMKKKKPDNIGSAGGIDLNKPRKYVSLRKKIVVKNILENNGNVSKAMRDAGYSESYSKNPQYLKKTKSLRDYLDEFMPAEVIAQAHNQLLNQKRVESFIVSSTMTQDDIDMLKELLKANGCEFRNIIAGPKGTFCFFFAPDGISKSKALDMLYKIKGEYKENIDLNIGKYRNLSDNELAQKISEATKFFTKSN